MIRGAIDFIDHDQVHGWARDDASPETAVSIVIADDSGVLGKIVANGFRADLRDAGIGTGHHAFVFNFPTGLSRERRYVIRLSTESGADLPGSPAVLEAAPAATTSAVGNLDVVDRHHVTGWARLDGKSDEPVSLIVTVNDQLSGRLVANLYRPDLEAAGIGSGRHAFDWSFPEPLSMLQQQVIHVRREFDGADVPGSPVTLQPPLEFDASTETSLSGLLARYGRADEIERKIHFLADELSRLIENKADRDSGRYLRRRNRDLLRRWGNTETAAARLTGDKLRALIIDDRIPALDRDAGSNAIVSHMRSLQRLGYEVSLIASSELRPTSSVTRLRANGFEILSLPFYGSTEELLWRQAGEFDLIYLHRISNAAKYGELVRQHFPKARKIFSVADLHHIRISRQAEVENRTELIGLANRLKFTELVAAATADAVITHSDYEAEILRSNLPKANIHRVLWSVDPRPTGIAFADRKGIAFIGGFEHAPNVDAAKWLMSSLMPRIRERAPEIVCYLVGSGFPAELAQMKADGIIVTGKVANLSEIFDRVRLTIAPLSYGAGVKGKIIESLAAGIPCVHTALAGEGMGLPDVFNVCRGDEVRAIADAVLKLHGDADLNQCCSQAGLKYVGEELSDSKLDLAMRQVVGTRQPGAAEAAPT